MVWRREGNLSSYFVRVWCLGFTQTHLFGFLFHGPRGCYMSKSQGNLEL